MTKALRGCRICGKEAHTKKDLKLFVKRPNQPHGHDTYCKECHNARARRYRMGVGG